MRSNTKWVWIVLVLLTIIGLQGYALYHIPQTHAKELQAIQVQKESLEQQSTQMESELRQLQEQLAMIQESYEDTRSELEETKSSLAKFEQDLEESHDEIEKLKKENEVKEQENRRLERELQSRLEKRQVQIASRNRATNSTQAKSAGQAGNAAAAKTTTASSSSNILTGFEVTWYNMSGKTASGRTTQDGISIAVDPSIIPLGTWVKLHFPDGTVQKRRADDTGGSVKGRRIDIYKNAPTSQLLSLGRVTGVKVEILD